MTVLLKAKVDLQIGEFSISAGDWFAAHHTDYIEALLDNGLAEKFARKDNSDLEPVAHEPKPLSAGAYGLHSIGC